MVKIPADECLTRFPRCELLIMKCEQEIRGSTSMKTRHSPLSLTPGLRRPCAVPAQEGGALSAPAAASLWQCREGPGSGE